MYQQYVYQQINANDYKNAHNQKKLNYTNCSIHHVQSNFATPKNIRMVYICSEKQSKFQLLHMGCTAHYVKKTLKH